MSKLTLLHINIIGVVMALIIFGALWFTVIAGAQEQIKTNETKYNQVKSEADKLPTAKRNLANAQKEEADTKRIWAVSDGTYMRRLGYTNNRIADMMRIWWPNNGKSWPEQFIKGFKAHMNKQRALYGIEWLNPDVVTFPPNGPNPNDIDWGGDPSNKSPTLHLGPYAMQVRGKSYQSLMSHIKSWNTIRSFGVPVIEGVNLNGNSPDLIATYNVTLTLIIRDTVPPPDQLITGGGGGGGGFGPPAGMGPGGMMGGMSMMGSGGGAGAAAGRSGMMSMGGGGGGK